MARFADVNNSAPAGFSLPVLICFALKTVLKLASWTIPRSSDGITYNASGDQITSAAAGAGGLFNPHAWFVAREPGGRREWCFQFGTTSTTAQARVKYSANAKFTGGTPGPTQTPSAADEQVLIGSGTNAAPVYASLLANATVRYHICADSTAIGGAYPFSVFFTLPGGSTQSTGLIAQEPMAPGSYSPSDADPVVVVASNVGSMATVAGWLGYGTAGQAWVAAMTANAGIFVGALGVDLGDGSDVNGYPVYSGTSVSVRCKGVGALIAAKGPARSYPATTNTATDAKVYLGNWAYPYPNNTVPSVS